MKIKLADIRQRWNSAKLTKSAAFWIAIGAVVLTLFLGFSRAGWMTSSAASKMAVTTSKDAVIERLAPICVAQANQDPLRAQKLEEFRALTTITKRASYVREQGWAIMPGETTYDHNVVGECARQLFLLDS